MTDLDQKVRELRALAEKATQVVVNPGELPWYPEGYLKNHMEPRDAAMVASLTPETMLAVLDEYDRRGAALVGAEGRNRVAAEYLTRLEAALVGQDLDMALDFDDAKGSPTSVAEEVCPGFDSIQYELDRAALSQEVGK